MADPIDDESVIEFPKLSNSLSNIDLLSIEWIIHTTLADDLAATAAERTALRKTGRADNILCVMILYSVVDIKKESKKDPLWKTLFLVGWKKKALKKKLLFSTHTLCVSFAESQ